MTSEEQQKIKDLETTLESANTLIEILKGEIECLSCGGTGKPVSKKVCACGGTGHLGDAYAYLLEENLKKEMEIELLGKAIESLRKKLMQPIQDHRQIFKT